MTHQERNVAGSRLLTVNELARAAGVDGHVVRFYARTGLIQPARYGANGYRQFAPLDVKRVRFVRAAQNLGFTLADIKEVMQRSRQRTTPCPLVRDIISRRLRENREHLDYVSELQKRMEQASRHWRHQPDQVPDGETICALIDSIPDAARVPVAKRMTRSRLKQRSA